LYVSKQTSYSENRIFPAVKFRDLRVDLIVKARKLAGIHGADRSWQQMTDKRLLETSSLYQKDPNTGEEGFTLAGILLFGRDEVIAAAVPGFRIDLIKRVDNPDRYDDRVDLRTNLIDAYERTMEFVAKHLPDPFYMDEKGQRINLRENIFREVVANIIVHKEYLGGEPTRFIIERSRVLTENSNRPYINGTIDISNLKACSKNPNIARFFRQIGRVEEIGSGIPKLYKFCKLYSGYDPTIIDKNIFEFILPVKFFDSSASRNAGDCSKYSCHSPHDSPHDNFRERAILLFCRVPRTRIEIQNYVKIKDREYFRKFILNPLVKSGKLMLTMPEKPRSKNQKYKSANRGANNDVNERRPKRKN